MNSQHTDTAKRRVIPFNTQQHAVAPSSTPRAGKSRSPR